MFIVQGDLRKLFCDAVMLPCGMLRHNCLDEYWFQHPAALHKKMFGGAERMKQLEAVATLTLMKGGFAARLDIKGEEDGPQRVMASVFQTSRRRQSRINTVVDRAEASK